MKTLKQHTILYDDECPLCKIYTKAFIKTAMLDGQGRKPFSRLSPEDKKHLDIQRACNQIALVNREDKTVMYGIDSLFAIIGYSLPLFKPLFQSRIFRLCCEKMYSFISYNRKIIAGSSQNTCVPDFHIIYRSLYVLITWLFTSVVLSIYVNSYITYLPNSNFFRELIVCGGQVFFQGIFLVVVKTEKKVIADYIGHLMTVSFGGALLLFPMIFVSGAAPLFYLIYFFVVVALMLAEHTRRVKLLKLPRVLSLTWVIYRLIVLWILL